MAKKKKDAGQIMISQEDLDRLHEADDQILALQGRIEELEAANEAQKERHAEELEEARRYLYLPAAIRVERVGRRTKFYDDLSGLQLYGYSKSKIDARDNKPATVTFTIETELRNMSFINEQLKMFDGESEEASTDESSQAEESEEALSA